MLLTHDQSKRPTAEELLTSELIPPATVEASELQEMLRHAFSNTNSKIYKNIVTKCLAQKSNRALEITYGFSDNVRKIDAKMRHEFVKVC